MPVSAEPQELPLPGAGRRLIPVDDFELVSLAPTPRRARRASGGGRVKTAFTVTTPPAATDNHVLRCPCNVLTLAGKNSATRVQPLVLLYTLAFTMLGLAVSFVRPQAPALPACRVSPHDSRPPRNWCCWVVLLDMLYGRAGSTASDHERGMLSYPLAQLRCRTLERCWANTPGWPVKLLACRARAGFARRSWASRASAPAPQHSLARPGCRSSSRWGCSALAHLGSTRGGPSWPVGTTRSSLMAHTRVCNGPALMAGAWRCGCRSATSRSPSSTAAGVQDVVAARRRREPRRCSVPLGSTPAE